MPTETVYGISACYDFDDSVRKVNRIKERDELIPQIILLQYSWIDKYIEAKYFPLLEILWPGPFSVLLPSSTENPFNTPKLCFRASPHPFVNEILEQLGRPITSTSANISEGKPLKYERELKEAFSPHVDLIVHDRADRPYSKIAESKASTLIDGSDFPNSIRLIRTGASRLEKINTIFPTLKVISDD